MNIPAIRTGMPEMTAASQNQHCVCNMQAEMPCSFLSFFVYTDETAAYGLTFCGGFAIIKDIVILEYYRFSEEWRTQYVESSD